MSKDEGLGEREGGSKAAQEPILRFPVDPLTGNIKLIRMGDFTLGDGSLLRLYLGPEGLYVRVEEGSQFVIYARSNRISYAPPR